MPLTLVTVPVTAFEQNCTILMCDETKKPPSLTPVVMFSALPKSWMSWAQRRKKCC